MIPIIYNQSLYQSKNRLHRQCEAYDDYQLKYPIYHSLVSFFSVEKFWLRKKRQIKRQIIKKRQIKKIKKSHEKQQISRLFIYRIKQVQLNTIYHYSNQKIDCIDSVRRMMTIRANTPFIIHSCHFFQLKIFNLEKKDK